LDGHCPARTSESETGIKIGAAIEDRWHRDERQHIIDDGWLREEPLMRRQGRFRPDYAAFAFEAFEEGRFLAAYIGTGAHPQLNLEGMSRALDVGAEVTRFPRDPQRLRKGFPGMGIFRPAIDIALGRADADAANRHAFDQRERIALHDHAVGERAAVAFVG